MTKASLINACRHLLVPVIRMLQRSGVGTQGRFQFQDQLHGEVRPRDADPLCVELGDPDVVMTWSEVPVGPNSDEVRARRRARLQRTMPVMQKNLKAMQDGGAIVAAIAIGVVTWLINWVVSLF